MFMAGAPLLYTRHDPPVVFGALIIFDSKPREVFTHREQGMLMRLANMLVYQLATFVSHTMMSLATLDTGLTISNQKYWPSPPRSCTSPR